MLDFSNSYISKLFFFKFFISGLNLNFFVLLFFFWWNSTPLFFSMYNSFNKPSYFLMSSIFGSVRLHTCQHAWHLCRLFSQVISSSFFSCVWQTSAASARIHVQQIAHMLAMFSLQTNQGFHCSAEKRKRDRSHSSSFFLFIFSLTGCSIFSEQDPILAAAEEGEPVRENPCFPPSSIFSCRRASNGSTHLFWSVCFSPSAAAAAELENPVCV